MNNLINPKNPILILIRGLPGSGKSYLANSITTKLTSDLVVNLDPDQIDFDSKEYKEHTTKLSEEGVDDALHAYRFLREKAYRGIENNKIIIWNQPFTNLEIFKKMIGRMEDHSDLTSKDLKIIIVEVEANHSTAKNRVEQRKNNGGHGPSDQAFDKFINDYFSFKHLGYETIIIDGEDDINVSTQKVLDVLTNI